MRLTAEQRRALDILRHADPGYDGEGVRHAGASDMIDGQAWINWRTAAALERRGLAACEGYGEEASIRVYPLCAFGPEGEHHGGELVRCDECGEPTCDFCGYGHNNEEDDWLCPHCAPEGKAGT